MKGNRNGNNPKKEFHGHRRTSSKNIRRQDDKAGNQFQSNDDYANGHMNDRLLYLIAKSIGCKAIVTVSSGARYKGILSAADMDKNLSIILRFPELHSPIPGQESFPDHEELPINLAIESKDLMDLELLDVDLNTNDVPSQSQSNIEDVKQTFRTDTDISGAKINAEERELQKWVSEPGDNLQGLSLDDDLSVNNSTWDQFSVNEQKFGVESTYDEHLYTTRINRNAPDYEQKLREAERIAKEIESQGYNGNIHLAEERGLVVDDSGIDEEDKYSGVDRRGDELMAALKGKNSNNTPQSSVGQNFEARSPGKYVPPRQRAAQYHNDPAIISSSALKDQKQQQQKIESHKSEEKGKKSQQEEEQKQPNQDQENQVIKQESPKQQQQKQQSSKGVNNIAEHNIQNKPSSIPAKPPVSNASLSKHKENKYPNESIRLTAQSEINSLKEFSQNFRIPQKFPKDLLPILAKDKTKQDEIIKKQLENNQKQLHAQQLKTNTPVGQSQTATSSPIPPISSISAPNPSSPLSNGSNPVKPKKKMDPRAPAFKMNIQAPSFTPQSPSYNKSPAMANQGLNRNYRRYTVTPHSFFGSRVPKENGKKDFHTDFNLFLTIKSKAEAREEKPIIGRTYVTPPTWEFTTDESYLTLIPSIESIAATSLPQTRPMMYPPSSPMAIPHMIPMAIPQLPYDANAPAFIPPGFIPGAGYPNYLPPNAFQTRGNFNGTPVIPVAAIPGYQNFQRGLPHGYPTGQTFNYAPPNGMRQSNPMSPQQNYSKFS